jgi:L-ascorbate metabolism protein UlaG (beta-lactamase superfamily)
VYFSGDTGLFPAMQTVGERYGPFDLTMIEVGQYDDDWPDWHLGPEQAVLAHQMVRGKVMLPVHWGLFRLAAHGWTEPIERVHVQAAEVGVTVTTPKPGQSLQPSEFGSTAAWWPDVPWTRASDNPINATVSGDKDQRMDLPALFERFSGP